MATVGKAAGHVVTQLLSHCFYNDAYSHSIGRERHPTSLGQPAQEVWGEMWHIIGPQIEHVRSGKGPTWNVDHLMPITRNGRREDVYWTYSYSPIDDDSVPGGIGGVLVICNETTPQVRTAHELSLERDRLSQLFEQAPSFKLCYAAQIIFMNQSMLHMSNLPAKRIMLAHRYARLCLR